MECVFQQRLMTLLQSPSQALAFKEHPLLIHNILWGSFFPLWRDYLAHYESIVLNAVRCRRIPIASMSLLTFRRPK